MIKNLFCLKSKLRQLAVSVIIRVLSLIFTAEETDLRGIEAAFDDGSGEDLEISSEFALDCLDTAIEALKDAY